MVINRGFCASLYTDLFRFIERYNFLASSAAFSRLLSEYEDIDEYQLFKNKYICLSENLSTSKWKK